MILLKLIIHYLPEIGNYKGMLFLKISQCNPPVNQASVAVEEMTVEVEVIK